MNHMPHIEIYMCVGLSEWPEKKLEELETHTNVYKKQLNDKTVNDAEYDERMLSCMFAWRIPVLKNMLTLVLCLQWQLLLNFLFFWTRYLSIIRKKSQSLGIGLQPLYKDVLQACPIHTTNTSICMMVQTIQKTCSNVKNVNILYLSYGSCWQVKVIWLTS